MRRRGGRIIGSSRFSTIEAIGRIGNRNIIGKEFDEVMLDCGRCGEKTLHSYKGYGINKSSGETEFNYKCNNCGRIYVSERRF